MRHKLKRMVDAVARWFLHGLSRFLATRPSLRAVLFRGFRYRPNLLTDAITRRYFGDARVPMLPGAPGRLLPENADWIFRALCELRPR